MTLDKFFVARALTVFLATSAPAFADEDSYIEQVSAAGECRKTHDGGCTAWATQEIRARPGYLFSIRSINIKTTYLQNCVEVKHQHVFGNIQNIATVYGPLPFTDYINLRVECQSGGGIGGLNQVYKIRWEGTVIANEAP